MSSLRAVETPQKRRWHRFDDTVALEHAAVAEILRAARQAINARGAFHIVLAGGTTPRKIYEALRAAQTEWHAWHVYYGDERCLPVAHPDRNSHMAATAWLDHVAIPPSQIHPISGEEGASDAAMKYAEIVSSVKFFDLVLLGIGEDGHTASLFPGHDAGASPDSPATLIIMDAPKPPAQRVSLSALRLSAAHEVMFLVTGMTKKQAISDWQKGIPIPAATITPEGGVDVYIEAALL